MSISLWDLRRYEGIKNAERYEKPRTRLGYHVDFLLKNLWFRSLWDFAAADPVTYRKLSKLWRKWLMYKNEMEPLLKSRSSSILMKSNGRLVKTDLNDYSLKSWDKLNEYLRENWQGLNPSVTITLVNDSWTEREFEVINYISRDGLWWAIYSQSWISDYVNYIVVRENLWGNDPEYWEEFIMPIRLDQ